MANRKPSESWDNLLYFLAVARTGTLSAAAEQLGLEGIVSKRLGSPYRSGRVETWRKIKCSTQSDLILIGTEIDKRSGAPLALLARQGIQREHADLFGKSGRAFLAELPLRA